VSTSGQNQPFSAEKVRNKEDQRLGVIRREKKVGKIDFKQKLGGGEKKEKGGHSYGSMRPHERDVGFKRGVF